MMSDKRDSQIVAITAGASGIGKVVAETFLARGSVVHVCDVDEDAGNLFAAEHDSLHFTRGDVSRFGDVQSFFSRIEEEFGRLDVLVNNAGVSGPTAPAESVEPADWDQTIAVNLHGQFYCAREAIPLLRANGGGSILNMSSNAAFSGFPLRAPYTASKWAIIGLTKTLAMELGVHGIRVNAICPGSVSGARIDGVIERDAAERGMTPGEIRDVYQRQSSMRLFVSARDVANTIVFLSSDEGCVISGQVLGIDGHTESLANWLD